MARAAQFGTLSPVTRIVRMASHPVAPRRRSARHDGLAILWKVSHATRCYRVRMHDNHLKLHNNFAQADLILLYIAALLRWRIALRRSKTMSTSPALHSIGVVGLALGIVATPAFAAIDVFAVAEHAVKVIVHPFAGCGGGAAGLWACAMQLDEATQAGILGYVALLLGILVAILLALRSCFKRWMGGRRPPPSPGTGGVAPQVGHRPQFTPGAMPLPGRGTTVILLGPRTKADQAKMIAAISAALDGTDGPKPESPKRPWRRWEQNAAPRQTRFSSKA